MNTKVQTKPKGLSEVQAKYFKFSRIMYIGVGRDTETLLVSFSDEKGQRIDLLLEGRTRGPKWERIEKKLQEVSDILDQI